VPSLENNNHRFFPQLTGIRAIAAYMVYIFHYNVFNSASNPSFAGRFFGDFNTGVNLFFVLSGFLIYYRYGDTVWAGGKGLYQYIVNRVARIYPMYIFFTTLTFAVMLSSHHFELTKVLAVYFANITFIKGFFDDLKFSGISQGWSLTVEECFYFMAPLIFLSLKKVNVVFQPLVLILLGCTIVCLFGSTHSLGFMQSYSFMMKFTFFGRCIEFYIGIYTAMLFKRKIKSGQFVPKKYGFYTYGGIMLMIISMACFAFIPAGIGHNNEFALDLLLNHIILNGGIGVLFFGLLTEATVVSSVLSIPLFQLLGKSSYVFYLIHMGPVHDFITSFVANVGWISTIVHFIMLIVLSIIIFRLMEEPLNKWVKNLFAKRKKEIVSVA
jgi:peptidoglycan/LPS O-acetylase OafA/YrhL